MSLSFLVRGLGEGGLPALSFGYMGEKTVCIPPSGARRGLYPPFWMDSLIGFVAPRG